MKNDMVIKNKKTTETSSWISSETLIDSSFWKYLFKILDRAHCWLWAAICSFIYVHILFGKTKFFYKRLGISHVPN